MSAWPSKKALSPYFVFVRKNRDKVRTDNPLLSVPALGKRLGELWRTLDDTARQPYIDESSKTKKEREEEISKYKLENPTWQVPKRRKIKHRKKKQQREVKEEHPTGVQEEPVAADE